MRSVKKMRLGKNMRVVTIASVGAVVGLVGLTFDVISKIVDVTLNILNFRRSKKEDENGEDDNNDDSE